MVTSSIPGLPDRSILSTGNSELDKKIADGFLNLTLIGGERHQASSPADHGGALNGVQRRPLLDRERAEASHPDGVDELDISGYFAWGYPG